LTLPEELHCWKQEAFSEDSSDGLSSKAQYCFQTNMIMRTEDVRALCVDHIQFDFLKEVHDPDTGRGCVPMAVCSCLCVDGIVLMLVC